MGQLAGPRKWVRKFRRIMTPLGEFQILNMRGGGIPGFFLLLLFDKCVLNIYYVPGTGDREQGRHQPCLGEKEQARRSSHYSLVCSESAVARKLSE